MLKISLSNLKFCALLTALIILCSALPAAAGLNDMFGKKEIDETERAETIEKIQSIQEKLQLLQEKLRVLERRKAYKEAAKKADELGTADIPNVQINWLGVDETTFKPVDAGVYTYLLFNGELSDTAAVGALEDFILTIETLPANEVPVEKANRFLLPVEPSQSSVSLGRQPYDFNLNKAYLRRLMLDNTLPNGPVLVSTTQALDPYGADQAPVTLAIALGRQSPQRSLELAKIWHQHESTGTNDDSAQISKLFWELIEDAGPTSVTRQGDKIQVELPQP